MNTKSYGPQIINRIEMLEQNVGSLNARSSPFRKLKCLAPGVQQMRKRKWLTPGIEQETPTRCLACWRHSRPTKETKHVDKAPFSELFERDTGKELP